MIHKNDGSEGYFHKIKCVLYMPGKYGTESICWSAAVCSHGLSS